MQRKKAREEAFKLLFESGFYPELSPEELLDRYYTRENIERDEYFDFMVSGTISQKEEIEKILTKYSKGWSAERITRVSLSILSLALFEIMHRSDVPIRVSANEAVELSKKYEGEEASAFINGILGSFIRSEGEQISKDERSTDQNEETSLKKESEQEKSAPEE